MTEPYSSELTARFGYDLDLGGEAEDNAWIRQVLLRRTHRRYDSRPVPESVLRLILAAVFSASSKSDFQQASVILVEDRGQRDRLAALIPDMPWIGNAPR
jgi:FMN reductase [NAD(P)H]